MKTGFYLGRIKKTTQDLIFFYENGIFYFKDKQYSIDDLEILDWPVITVVVQAGSSNHYEFDLEQESKIDLEIVRIDKNGNPINLLNFGATE